MGEEQDKAWVTYPDAGRLIGVDPRQIRRYIEQRQIEPVVVDGKKRLLLSDVKELAAKRRTGQLPPPDRPDYDEDDERDAVSVSAEYAQGLQDLNRSSIALVKQSHDQILELIKLVTGPARSIQASMENLLRIQEERIKALEASRDQMLQAREQALDFSHDRELERAEVDAQNKRVDSMLEMVQQAAPLLIMASTSKHSEADDLKRAIGEFATSLDEKTLKRMNPAKVAQIERIIHLASEKPTEKAP